MKKNILCLILSGLTLCCFAAGKSLLFEANFDNLSLNANHFSAGDGKCLSFANPDLQLRMYPGLNNKGNSVVLDGTEFCEYAAPGNFDASQGTISIWVAPINWKPSEKTYQLFFDTCFKKTRFIVYKNNFSNCFYFLIQYREAKGTKKSFAASSFIPDVEWPAGKWHKFDATWDSSCMKLYVDGIQVKDHAWHKATFVFPETMNFPQPEAGDTFCIGAHKKLWNSSHVKPSGKTAFDGLRIYNRPLSADEIRENYNQSVPSTFGSNREPNLLTVPLIDTMPNLDGNIEPAEWSDATVVPVNEIMENSNIKQALADVKAYLKYNGKTLYLAMHSDYKPRKPAILEDDGRVWRDDCFELHLRQKDKFHYHFIFNAIGKIYDAKDNIVDWNAGARAVARQGDFGWCFEAALPLEQMPEIKPGETIEGGLFHAVVATSTCYQGWYDRGKPMFADNLAKIRFGTDDTAFNLEYPGDMKNGKVNFMLTSNSKNKLTTEACIKAENGDFIAYEGNLLQNRWETFAPAGRNFILVKVLEQEQPLFVYEKYFTVSKPVEINFSSRPSQGVILTEIDLGNAGASIVENLAEKPFEGTLSLSQGDDTFSLIRIKQNQIKQTWELPLPKELKAGTYAIRAKLGELENQKSFRVPDMSPYKARLGDDHTVPEPWTPIKKSAELTFELLDRTYVFGSNPAPIKVVSCEATVLDSAPEWKINGKNVQWTKAKVIAAFDDYIELEGSGTADNLTFEWKGKLCFDGVYKLDFFMAPTTGSLELDSFNLSWMTPRPEASYVLTPVYNPWVNDRIELCYVVAQPNSNRDFFVWTQSRKPGFMWWPKSLANFVNKENEKQVVLTRDNDYVYANVGIITVPAKLTRKAEYTMAFMGTPAKPPVADWRQFHFSGWRKAKCQNAHSIGWDVFKSKESIEDCTSAAGHVPAYPDKFNEAVESWSKLGIKPYLYCMPAHFATVDPEYDYFYDEWAKTPTYLHTIVKKGVRITNEPCCGHTAITDLITWRLEKLFSSYPDLAGLYYDLADVRHCENRLHGCGGIDAFGKAYVSSIALNMHEYMQRVYKICRKHDRRLILHAHNLFNPIAHSYGDYWYPGEHTFSPLAQNIEHYYCEGISLEAYQSEYNSESHGCAISFLPQYARVASGVGVESLKSRFKEFLFSEEYAIRTMAPLIVHDINVSAEFIDWETVGRWWELQEQMRLDKAVFYGYWFDDAVKTQDEKMLASWYELPEDAPYSRLIVVSNFSREPKPANLAVNFKKMELLGNLAFYDLWNKKSMTKDELQTAIVGANHFMLIGISVLQ